MSKEQKKAVVKDRLTIRLGVKTRKDWDDYCKLIKKHPSTAIKEAIKQQLKSTGKVTPAKIYKQVEKSEKTSSKKRFEVLLTESEKKALFDHSKLEGCTPRRWVIDAIRAGLTQQAQFSMKEIEALGESNYQLLAIGRNLNQIAKRLNEGNVAHVTTKEIIVLRKQIEKHIDTVSTAIRASLERWKLE